MTLIIIPGIGGSDDTHWQSLWQRDEPAMMRIAPASWDAPDLADWIAALDRAVERAARPPLLVAHSLGCLLVAHWAGARPPQSIAGAFLVAVPDANGAAFPDAAASFRSVPDTPLRFPVLILASSDDPYASLDHTHERARRWHAEILVAGALGHINAASGLGAWPQGAALLRAFRAGCAPRGRTERRAST
jgi:uncharacterized protein